ncbi:MAG TPA: hypothetical protein VM347_33940 [Nonomuraea sp.]|nr:hypothetical protein [Nonomuraea sp.]
MSIYVSWSYPAEAGRNPAELDNRFSTMTEVRRVNWPAYEDPKWSDPLRFQQGIAGSLELFFWGWAPFQQFTQEATGHPVPVYQRIDQAGFPTPLDERVLADTDTLLLFGLDHAITGQEPAPEEIEALRRFLAREGTCLVLGPHHDVGASDDLAVRDAEYQHHGDALVPRQQRFARYVRTLMRGFGARRGPLRPAPRRTGAQEDRSAVHCQRPGHHGMAGRGDHSQLPHAPAALRRDDRRPGRRPRAGQAADRPVQAAHPFNEAGGTEFNVVLWMPPEGERAGDILLADSTVFSSLFGGDESLRAFWTNIVSSKSQ